MKKILYDKEQIFLGVINKSYGKRDLHNILDFWGKIRNNKTKFKINTKISNLINDIDKIMVNIESNMQMKEEEKKKNISGTSQKNINSFIYQKKKIINNKFSSKKMNKLSSFKQENNKENKIPINNIENKSFNYSEEILDKNIFEINKNNQKIISFIDIDLFLQRIAEGKKIYNDNTMENNLMNGFCIQYTAFINTDILVSKIISCFNYFYSKYVGGNEKRIKSGEKQLNKKDDKLDKNILNGDIKLFPDNVINLLILFINLNNNFCKETFDLELINKLQTFFKDVLKIYEMKHKYSNEIQSSLDKLKELYNSLTLRRTISAHNKIPYENLFPKRTTLMDLITSPDNPISYFSLLDFNSGEIALELTYISYKLFSKIQPKEFLKGVFTKKNKSITSPNITEISNRFNKVSFWAIEEILMYDHASERAKIIEKYIDIINELVKLNNFFDSISIISGLSQITISNLSKSWGNVSKQSKEKYKKLKEFLSFEDNYKNIREKINECVLNKQPYIPFLSPYSKTICYLEEYGPYIKDNSLINVDKIVLVQQVFEQLFKFKLNSYNKLNNTKNELFILYCLDPASEEELEKLASRLEPIFILFDKKKSEKRASNTEKNFKTNYENNKDLIE